MTHSAITKRRLADGERARTLYDNPQTEEEVTEQLAIIHDGIVALQSLDDLGTEEENQAAWNDMLRLQARHEALVRRLDEIQNRNMYP